MGAFVLVGIAAGAGLIGLAIWITQRRDGTVVNRMASSDRVDGERNPHAHLPHSHI